MAPPPKKKRVLVVGAGAAGALAASARPRPRSGWPAGQRVAAAALRRWPACRSMMQRFRSSLWVLLW